MWSSLALYQLKVTLEDDEALGRYTVLNFMSETNVERSPAWNFFCEIEMDKVRCARKTQIHSAGEGWRMWWWIEYFNAPPLSTTIHCIFFWNWSAILRCVSCQNAERCVQQVVCAFMPSYVENFYFQIVKCSKQMPYYQSILLWPKIDETNLVKLKQK